MKSEQAPSRRRQAKRTVPRTPSALRAGPRTAGYAPLPRGRLKRAAPAKGPLLLELRVARMAVVRASLEVKARATVRAVVGAPTPAA